MFIWTLWERLSVPRFQILSENPGPVFLLARRHPIADQAVETVASAFQTNWVSALLKHLENQTTIPSSFRRYRWRLAPDCQVDNQVPWRHCSLGRYSPHCLFWLHCSLKKDLHAWSDQINFFNDIAIANSTKRLKPVDLANDIEGALHLCTPTLSSLTLSWQTRESSEAFSVFAIVSTTWPNC